MPSCGAFPDFAPGDRVKVHFQVIEGTRRRVQVFEGVVIKRQGHGARETFTVRKQSFGVGVERTFPVHSPKIERIEMAARGDVRRAKLYYLRDRVGKRARVRERRYTGPEEAVQPGLLHEAQEEQPTDADGATAEGTLAEGPLRRARRQQRRLRQQRRRRGARRRLRHRGGSGSGCSPGSGRAAANRCVSGGRSGERGAACRRRCSRGFRAVRFLL